MSLKHYKSISENFEENWFFSEDYFPTLCALLTKNLCLKNGDKFVDLGCGTGNYTEEIIKSSDCELDYVLGVDFSKQMIEQFSLRGSNYNGVSSDLESFVSSTKLKFDRILIKEVIHHVKNYKKFYADLNNILNPAGETLIVTRPQNTNFPFFKKALKFFSENQISKKSIINSLSDAKFITDVSEVKINISISKKQLFKMIKNRFMSTFNHFTDEEINIGIDEVSQKFAKSDTIEFYDELIFIKAIKNN